MQNKIVKMITLEQIDKSRVPQHVAIIMDGNGRWAMKQQHERLFGHRNAFTAVRQAVEAAVQMGTPSAPRTGTGRRRKLTA